MSMERCIAPCILDTLFFDDIFEDVNREICRMHHDLRHGMTRLTPCECLSKHESLPKHMKSVRDFIVTKKDGSKEFRLNVDMNVFKPEEIDVKTKGRTLSISAKHSEETDNSSVTHEFTRSIKLPEGVNAKSLECSLSRDGVMTIKGPAGNNKGSAATSSSSTSSTSTSSTEEEPPKKKKLKMD